MSPLQREKVRKLLIKSPKLDLSDSVIDDLSAIGEQPGMLSLDISYAQLTSLMTLKKQTGLTKLIANNSLISSFKNFLSMPSLRSVSLLDTPVSKKPHYRLSLVVLFGDQLISIDGKRIPESLRDKARSLPSIIKTLINSGWDLKFPLPDDEEASSIIADAASTKADTEDPSDSDLSAIIAETISPAATASTEASASTEDSTLEDTTGGGEGEEDLLEKTALLLESYGYSIDLRNKEKSVLEIVDYLASQ